MEGKESPDKVGEGAFGDVYRAMWSPGFVEPGEPLAGDGAMEVKSSDEDRIPQPLVVAVKVMEMDEPRLRKRFLHEVALLAENQRNSTQAIRLYGASNTGSTCYIVMEYMPHGDLHNFIHNKKVYSFLPLNPWPLLPVLLSVAQAVADLHEAGIVHRDLKPSNFLMHRDEASEEWSVKVCDLGLSLALWTWTSSSAVPQKGWVGTYAYSAPEYLNMGSMTYTKEMDVYSLAVILWEALNLTVPFHAYTGEDIKTFVCNNRRLPLDRYKSSALHLALRPIIERCWGTASVRYTARVLYSLLQDIIRLIHRHDEKHLLDPWISMSFWNDFAHLVTKWESAKFVALYFQKQESEVEAQQYWAALEKLEDEQLERINREKKTMPENKADSEKQEDEEET